MSELDNALNENIEENKELGEAAENGVGEATPDVAEQISSDDKEVPEQPADDEEKVEAPKVGEAELPAADEPPVSEESPVEDVAGEQPVADGEPAAQEGDKEKPETEKSDDEPKLVESADAAPEAPVAIDPTSVVTTDDVPKESEQGTDEKAGEEQGEKKDEGDAEKEASVPAAPAATAAATAPIEVVEVRSEPDMATLHPDAGSVSTGKQLQVGEDYVAEGYHAGSVAMAQASFFCLGNTFADWLSEQGLTPWAAPALTKFVAKKQGTDARLPSPQWSYVVQQFYAQG